MARASSPRAIEPSADFVEHRLARRGQVPSRGQQPGVEPFATSDGDPVQQVGPQAREVGHVRPVAADHQMCVDRAVRRQPQDHRISVDRSALAETTPDFRQAPTQSAERVVGIGEEQRRESVRAGGRSASSR